MAGKQGAPHTDVRRPFGSAGIGALGSAGIRALGSAGIRALGSARESPAAAQWRLEAGFGDRAAKPPAALSVALVKQVHGDRLADADEVLAGAVTEADGLIVRRAGVLAAVKTADCVPVLLLGDIDGPPFAAAVHAGWRGTVAGIVERAVERALGCGAEPSRLQARLGPSIGPCCYEVGEEVAARFERERLPVLRDGPRPRLDLRAINSILLERAGLRCDRIRHSGPCTRCRRDLYWSYRVDPGTAGRQLSWIGWAVRDA